MFFISFDQVDLDIVRNYQLAKLQVQNKSLPLTRSAWAQHDYRKLLEEVGEVGVELMKQNNYGNICDEIADVFICLLCLASNYEIDVQHVVSNKITVLQERLSELKEKI